MSESLVSCLLPCFPQREHEELQCLDAVFKYLAFYQNRPRDTVMKRLLLLASYLTKPQVARLGSSRMIIIILS